MTIYDFKAKKRKDGELDLSSLKGKIILIVNTATGCGFTPQYKGLEELYQKYHDKGFEILDFPCNQFGSQAPGSDSEIHEFCTLKYNTTFDQLAKIEVNGENADPLFKYLKEQIKDEDVKGFKDKATMKMLSKLSKSNTESGDIKWNFTKFLVDREGSVVKRYAPVHDAADIDADIQKLM